MAHVLRCVASYAFYRAPAAENIPTKPNLPRETASESSVDIAAPSYRCHYFFANFTWLLFSGAVIATMAVMLHEHQDFEVPAWKADISLNSTVAWLAMVAKLALMIPLAECIGQAKWALFAGSRRKMSDLDLADSASRDAVGAMGWIVRFRGGLLVHFGAALVVVSLGFDPAMQHLLRYDLVSVVDPTQKAFLAANPDYSPVRGLDRGLVFATPKAALWGAYSAILGQPVPVNHECPSGECTFPANSPSVGIYSSCIDITGWAVPSCTDLTSRKPFCPSKGSCYTSGQMCNYTHERTGARVGGGETFLSIVANGAEFTNSTDGQVSITHEIVNVIALFIPPDENEDAPDTGPRPDGRLPIAPGYFSGKGQPNIKAYDCNLSYRDQRLSPSITGGKLNDTVVGVQDASALTMPRVDIAGITDSLLSRRVNITKSPDSARVSVAALFALSRGFAASLTGNSSRPDAAFPVPGTISEFHRAMYENLLASSFEDVMTGMAMSMTNAIRNDGGSKGAIRGDVWVKRLFVRVDWAWIALPGAVWVGVLVLLVVTSVKARRAHQPWLGTSQLAAVFVALENEVRMDVDEMDGGWRDKAGMSKVGERLKCRVAPVHAVSDNRARMEFTRLNSAV